MNEIEYKPTPDNIRLTPEQDALMVQAIKHIDEAPTQLKALTRWQFWFRQIYDAGKADALKNVVVQSEGDFALRDEVAVYAYDLLGFAGGKKYKKMARGIVISVAPLRVLANDLEDINFDPIGKEINSPHGSGFFFLQPSKNGKAKALTEERLKQLGV